VQHWRYIVLSGVALVALVLVLRGGEVCQGCQQRKAKLASLFGGE
jgi:hypothetical protein